MSSTTGKDKVTNEKYQTPIPSVKALLKYLVVRPTDKFLEPCRADGNIFNLIELPEDQKFWAELDEGVDYLETNFPRMDLIVTNPPFSLTEEFVNKGLGELNHDGTAVFLQRVNYLGSIKRLDFWGAAGFPNKTPVIVPRPKFVNGNGDSCEYMWMIWDNGNRFPDIPSGLSHVVDETSSKVIKFRKASEALCQD